MSYFDPMIKKSYRLEKRHIDFLDKVDKEDNSRGLRKILDNNIKKYIKEKREDFQKQLNITILLACLSMILFYVAYATTDSSINILFISIGLFILSFGTTVLIAVYKEYGFGKTLKKS